MTGHETQETEPATESATEPSTAPVAPAPGPARRGRIAAVAGSVLLVAALVAGVGVTAVTVRDADRDAGAPTWKFPTATVEEKKAVAQRGLAGMLVPYGTDGWVRGPDLAEFGSDAQLSGAQATALRKEALRGLPRSQRKQLERQIDRQRLSGMAMRSYFSGESYASSQNSGIYSVNVVLAQMANRTAVRNSSEAQNEFLAALDLFKEGPKIKGHDDARCFRLPGSTDEDLDMMLCSAYVGDVLVSVTAYGARPLDTKGVAMLLRTQLDRIAEPGEAV
ncbi:hypothetical protein OOK27_18935 [Streptomyces canus]|uniref:hypothetical protein n=1 Tax=Streptomyces canus TaxID=58343 RepID=UPI002255A8A3|nr:hypothetical protein [Streptomyces canus]MCX5256178.1 hypothetical protein [Streptomyces canus]